LRDFLPRGLLKIGMFPLNWRKLIVHRMPARKGHARLAGVGGKRQRRLEAVKKMHAGIIRGIVGAGFALVAGAGLAQDSNNRVAAYTDWSVFEASGPTQCWSVSGPKETVITENGKLVTAQRGDILLFVSYIPGSNVKGQVSFAGGYRFRDGSTVSLDIGGTKFELFTDGEMAWSASDADDAKIVTAMKRGAEAIVIGFSSRGKKTEDRFSLFGFTAAVEEAEKRCAS
jgi:invasion associated locus B (IalB) protein